MVTISRTPKPRCVRQTVLVFLAITVVAILLLISGSDDDEDSFELLSSSFKISNSSYIKKQYSSPERQSQTRLQSQHQVVLLYVTFSHLLDTSRFDKFILPALDTFLAPIQKYHVVLAQKWKSTYSQLCLNQTYAPYCPRIRPLFVDCPEGRIGVSPCCKQEKGLLEMLKLYNADWIVFMDDDMYVRSSHLRAFVSQFDSNQPMLVIGGGRRSSHRALGQPGFARFSPYHCSKSNPHYLYPWGQPVIYSRGALWRIRSGLQAGGLVRQCRTFLVSHDVGNSILHWIYSLPVVLIRFFLHAHRDDGESFGVHGILHATAKTMSGKKQPKTMYQVHEIFERTFFNESDVVWHNVSGFRNTATFQRYGDPITWGNDWHTVPVHDCLDASDAQVWNKGQRLHALQYKCANILNRLEFKPEECLKVYRDPCTNAFSVINSENKTATKSRIADWERKTAAFDEPWLYFEKS